MRRVPKSPVIATKAAARQSSFAVVPSQRKLSSDQYEIFSPEQQSTSSTSLRPSNQASRTHRRTGFVVPDTQEPGSSDYSPATATTSAVHTITQENGSLSAAAPRASSSVEEISQFRHQTGPNQTEGSDPISDCSLPTAGVHVFGRQPQPTASDLSSRESRSLQKSANSRPSSRSSFGDRKPAPSLLLTDQANFTLYSETPQHEQGVEHRSSAALEQADTHKRGQANNAHYSNDTLNAIVPQPSPTPARDWANVTQVSGTADVVPSIERSPPSWPQSNANLPSQRSAPQSIDQVDISTEGEYSGPSDTIAVVPRPGPSHAGRQSQPRLTIKSPLLRQLRSASHSLSHIRKSTPSIAGKSTPGPPSSSTRFAAQLPRTPLRTMDATSSDSTPQSGGKEATWSLEEKFTDASWSTQKRGRTLKDIALARAVEDVTRSPSTIPNQYPFPNPPNSESSRMKITDFGPELPTVTDSVPISKSEAFGGSPVLAAPAVDHPSPLSDAADQIERESFSPLNSFPNLGSNEYALALPSPASSTDAYRKHLNANSGLIVEFCSRQTWANDADIVVKAEKLVQQLKNYVTHADLENEDALSQQSSAGVSLSALSEWDMSVSSKFNFLGHLLSVLKDVNVQIAVASASSIILGKLKVFLKGRGVRCNPTTVDINGQGKPSSVDVSLIQTAQEVVEVPSRTDLIITFDNTFDASDTKYLGLRRGLQQNDYEATVLHLFVNYSIEHVERCLSPQVTGVGRLQRLLNTSTDYRRSAGKVDEDDPKPKDAAALLASYLLEQAIERTTLWPLPVPETIDVEPLSQSSSGVGIVDGEIESAALGHKRTLVIMPPRYASAEC